MTNKIKSAFEIAGISQDLTDAYGRKLSKHDELWQDAILSAIYYLTNNKFMPNDRINEMVKSTEKMIKENRLLILKGLSMYMAFGIDAGKSVTNKDEIDMEIAKPVIFVPTSNMYLVSDPDMFVSSMVFVCAQIADFDEGNIFDPDDALRRGRAWESEYALTIKRLFPEKIPNSHHQKLLEEFPDGIGGEMARNIFAGRDPKTLLN